MEFKLIQFTINCIFFEKLFASHSCDLNINLNKL